MDYELNGQLISELFDITSGRVFDEKSLYRVRRELILTKRLAKTWQLEGIIEYKGLSMEINKKALLAEMETLQGIWYLSDPYFYRLKQGPSGSFFVERIKSDQDPSEWECALED